jgi:hypothetical protein
MKVCGKARDQAAYHRMPALIAREHIGYLAFVCPGLPCPVAVLDDADDVHHPPARDPVVHDMAVRSQPAMRNNLKAEDA